MDRPGDDSCHASKIWPERPEDHSLGQGEWQDATRLAPGKYSNNIFLVSGESTMEGGFAGNLSIDTFE